ncbi:hypothetical protein [Aquimarina algiphila]|uniref:HK97 gp10 family phage protein n=1 Tax=Aquimarina algiphila TaxID=2047982 RepID=A0A554VE53_9FLAO|nr:hypothetical protein [Aquimarina algiphila]TSE05245.1 hypothetical protein FOF46_23565 [Aquimarina algiphila]
MLSLEPKIREILEELEQEFKDKHESLGMKATGDWLDSFDIQSRISGGTILANEYTEQLVQGRSPGKMPPIDPIEKWVNVKLGISGKEARGVAFAVATKIKNSGTDWYQQGGSDLVDDVFTDQRRQKIIDDLGTEIGAQVADNLRREIIKVFS